MVFAHQGSLNARNFVSKLVASNLGIHGKEARHEI